LPRRVYITGVSGLLGANLALELKQRYVIGGADLVPAQMPELSTMDVVDLLDTERLRECLTRFSPDVVIHCAALVDVDYCERNQDHAFRANAGLPEILSSVCSDLGIKLIHISTDCVFDGTKQGEYTENDVPCPVNVYARAKLQGEISVLREPSNVVLRTNIYGWNYRSKQSLGEWIYHSLLEDKTLRMFTDVFFSPILVNHLSQIIKEIVDRGISGLYHAVGSSSITKCEFGRLLKEVFAIETGSIVEVSVDDHGFAAKRPKNLSLSNAKLRSALGVEIPDARAGLLEFKRLLDSGYVERLRGGSSCGC